MRYFFWGLVFIGAVVAVDFAASNTQTLTIGLWPFTGYALSLPLYLLVLVLGFGGFFVGRLAGWFAGRRRRREWRQRGQRIEALERELSELGARRPAAEDAPDAPGATHAADAPAIERHS